MSRRHLIGLPKESPLRRAARIVDRSGVVDLLEQWRREDRARAGKGLGGRPKHVSDRAVLVAWVALAIDKKPMIVIDMADLIATADADTLKDLGVVPGAIRPDWYSRVWRSLHSVLDLIDPHPIRRDLGGDRRTKMTKVEFDALLARRDPEETARKAERLHEFTNALIEASVRECPEDLLGRWMGNVVVDGTLVRAWGKHGTSKKSDWVASEPDGGWYCREGDHSDKRSNGERVAWGWDATVVSMSPNTGPHEPDHPLLGLGLELARPGHRPGQLAAKVYASIASRGHPTALAIGDGIYLGGSTPANYHHPARAAGYGLIGEYHAGTPAITIAEQGAIQVDGSWYCPSMPTDLINATVDKRSGKIDEKTWRARIDRRTLYMVRPNGKIEPDGYQRFRCPASGTSATVACPLKGEPPKAGLTAVTITPKHPDKVCTQKSITIGPSPGAKWRQDLQYGTEAWRREMGRRNEAEHFNADLKSAIQGALDSAGRRQVKGRTAATVFTAITIVAENVRRLDVHLARSAVPKTPKPRSKRRRDQPGSWGEESPLRRKQPGPAPPAAA